MEQVPHGEVEGVQRGALAMNVVGHGDALAWHAERQALGMVQNLLQLAKLDWPVLDCSTVCRRQKTLQVELSSLRTKSPLQLLVDITGIKFPGEGEWKREKHGAEYRRAWRKVHLGIDAQMLEIRAIDVTSNAIGDAPMLPELLTQILADECIKSVCADGAYDTRGCLDAIAERQAIAVIPPRKNASHWKKSSARSAHCCNATRPFARASAWVTTSERSGAATTGAALWRGRCTASSGWESA